MDWHPHTPSPLVLTLSLSMFYLFCSIHSTSCPLYQTPITPVVTPLHPYPVDNYVSIALDITENRE